MNANEQTIQQIERALRKASSKYSPNNECYPLTDLYIQVKQESGELLVFNDDDVELTRCVIEEWIGNTDEKFYSYIQPILCDVIENNKEITENVAILKPYSYVLIGEDRETIADLHIVDNDTIIISDNLMTGLGEDLDLFWEDLCKKY